MLGAIGEARRTIDSFIQTFLNPKPNQKSFLLKVVFEHPKGNEHIWLADLDLASAPPTGVVANEPRIPGLKFMSGVAFSVSDVTDWMYLEGDFLVGGFTTRVLQAREKQAQKKGFKRFFPWRRSS
jgi:uncharacterized protein YegJ (DUF2314 family)